MKPTLALDAVFMQRALQLARKGQGWVSPNPMVGCVIVRDGKILAEGYHQKYGGAHAEVNALKKIGEKAAGATLYVTLEPCHHFGKTPPCVDAVLRAKISRVVIAMRDPNPLTCGKSVRKLRAAGVTVTEGVCEDEARELNRFFIKAMTTKQPYVIVKVAQSLDGMISPQKGKSGWITSEVSRQYVQELRQSVDAILVGRKTVLIDDPLLTVRKANVIQPKRVILDSMLRTRFTHKLFCLPGGELIFLCSQKVSAKRIQDFTDRGAQVVAVKSGKGGLDLKDVLKKLGELRLNSLLVEGGAEVFTSFAKSNLVDEWQFVIAPRVIGNKGLPAFLKPQSWHFASQKILNLSPDVLWMGRP